MNHDKPVNLYLVVAPGEIERLRPLIRIIITQLINRQTAKMEFADGTSKAGYKHRLLLMLDEMTSLGKIKILEEALAYMAGYGLKAYLIVQDLVQLNNKYGKENAILGNCHVKIAYAPNNPDTAKILSEMAGKATVVEEKTSLSGSRTGMLKNASVSISETARPLLTQDECSRLPAPEKDAAGRIIKPGHMLIFTAGQSPVYGMQILYFLDPVFSARSRMPAPARSDVIRLPAGTQEAAPPAAPPTSPATTASSFGTHFDRLARTEG
jgi:type IV secretion system protein VirD4